MRITVILVVVSAILSTSAESEANRYNEGSAGETQVTRLVPVRYDGYKFGYSAGSETGNIKSWDGEYPSRYGGHHSSLAHEGRREERSGGNDRYGYDIGFLEEEITKAFLDRRGNSRRDYDSSEGHRTGQESGHGSEHGEVGHRSEHGRRRLGSEQGGGRHENKHGGGGHRNEHEDGNGSDHAGGSGYSKSGRNSDQGSRRESSEQKFGRSEQNDRLAEHGILSEQRGNSGGYRSRVGHSDNLGRHFESSGGQEIGSEHSEISRGYEIGSEHVGSSGGGEQSSGGILALDSVVHSTRDKHVKSSEQTQRFDGHTSFSRGSAGRHGSGFEHMVSEDRHQEKYGGEQHGRETSRQGNRRRNRYEDRYEDRYGDSDESELLRDRLNLGSEHLALIKAFNAAGRRKDYKGSYDEHEEEFSHERLEKGLGFFAHRDTSDEHLQLKSYYLKGDSPESYEYNPYKSYRQPYGYHRRYEQSSEESKEYYGYKGIYFGSKERTGFIRDFVKSKGSEEKSKSKSGEGSESKGKSEEKSKSKSKGITEEYKAFVKDILKDLEKGLGIKSQSKGDDKGKGDKGKGDKGKGDEKGKGNKNGLFGGDLVNVIKVTFGHEEKKAEKKSDRRRRSTTRYARKFLDIHT